MQKAKHYEKRREKPQAGCCRDQERPFHIPLNDNHVLKKAVICVNVANIKDYATLEHYSLNPKIA